MKTLKVRNRVSSEKDKILKAITTAINEYINPALESHSGSIQIKELIVTNKINLFINYIGSCSSCSLSRTDTISFIKNLLEEELKDLNINKELSVEILNTEELKSFEEIQKIYHLTD